MVQAMTDPNELQPEIDAVAKRSADAVAIHYEQHRHTDYHRDGDYFHELHECPLFLAALVTLKDAALALGEARGRAMEADRCLSDTHLPCRVIPELAEAALTENAGTE